VSNLPFGNYAAEAGKSAFGLNDNDTRLLFEGEDPSRFATGNMGLSSLGDPVGDILMGRSPDLLKTAMAFGPKFGGRQAERTIRGLQDMTVLPDVKIQNAWNGSGEPVVSRRDFLSSYSAGGNLRFAPEPTAGNMAKAALFGSFSTAEGREYLRSGAKPLSEKQTSKVEETYKDAFTRDLLSPAVAVDALRNLGSADTDGSGGRSKAEIEAYIYKVAAEHRLNASQIYTLRRLIEGAPEKQAEKTGYSWEKPVGAKRYSWE
jgi:hypothetical protein